MPEMEDDSHATIGLTASAQISGIPGAEEDPTMVQDPGLPWDEFFTKSGETPTDHQHPRAELFRTEDSREWRSNQRRSTPDAGDDLGRVFWRPQHPDLPTVRQLR